jgi:transcriptional regulator with XRE-family HTH domain
MKLGQRIRARRTELGWTQEELAKRAGLSNGFLSDLENGKRGTSADTLLDLARVLGVSLDHLMTGTDEGAQVKQEVEIPRALADFAEAEALSFRRTLMLLELQRQIVAHRSASKKEDPGQFDWAKFYHRVREFL